jgi:hypothetical protein
MNGDLVGVFDPLVGDSGTKALPSPVDLKEESLDAGGVVAHNPAYTKHVRVLYAAPGQCARNQWRLVMCRLSIPLVRHPFDLVR